MLAVAGPPLTWDLVLDVRQLFEFPFMVNAFRAGTIVAVTAGLVGWFMVLRRQTFAGHTLAVVGFPGNATISCVSFSVMRRRALPCCSVKTGSQRKGQAASLKEKRVQP